MKKELVALILVVLSTAGVVVAVVSYEKYQRDRVFTVDLLARAPENGNWYPREIKLKEGEKVKLRIRNIETVTHGFAIPALDIAVDDIRAGEVKVVEFTPRKKGQFDFMCTVWCSRHHLSMTGKVTVE